MPTPTHCSLDKQISLQVENTTKETALITRPSILSYRLTSVPTSKPEYYMSRDLYSVPNNRVFYSGSPDKSKKMPYQVDISRRLKN